MYGIFDVNVSDLE